MNSLQSPLAHRQVLAIPPRQPGDLPGTDRSDCDALLQRRIAALLECSARYLLGPDAPDTPHGLRQAPPCANLPAGRG